MRKPLPTEYQSKSKGEIALPADPLATRSTDIHPIAEEETPAVCAGMESLDLLEKLIRRLPTREREVVRLFYFEGRTYEEISIDLNLPVKTIGPILKRARVALRQYEEKAEKRRVDRNRR